MSFRLLKSHFLTHFLAISILWTAYPLPARAENKSEIKVNVGEPNIWSLGQAHYLLASMRNKSNNWSVKVPEEGFDPNDVNGVRYDILRSFLGVDAQYSAVLGAQNQMQIQKYQAELSRREATQQRLSVATDSYIKAAQEFIRLDREVNALPSNDPTRAQLEKDRDAQKTLRDSWKVEMDTLNTQLASFPTSPTLSATPPFTTPTPSTRVEDIGAYRPSSVTLSESNKNIPKVSASVSLDNIVNMQYELIAKQLTLLRDEVRPGERLVFLEMPSDLYSVPKKDDDYLLKIDWDVTGYVGDEQEIDEDEEEKQQGCPKSVPRQRSSQIRPITRDVLNRYLELKEKALSDASLVPVALRLKALEERAKKEKDEQSKKINQEIESYKKRCLLEDKSRELVANQESPLWELAEFVKHYPSLWGKNSNPAKQNQSKYKGSKSSLSEKFRVVDIIPRQSALNVNDTQAQQKGLALTAQFLSIFGLGGKVSYERQRTLYGQFIQQEVYASAFGKGQDHFGWTFGPLPGVKRLAPGVRTTFAILAIPDDAVSFDLRVNAHSFHRKKSPWDEAETKEVVEAKTFRIIVPGEHTDGFWVDRVNYTPVKSDDRATVILRGRYFSPLTGILVDGKPLRRAVSLTSNEFFGPTSILAPNSPGEYEYLNPNEIILSIPVPKTGFVGTPLITLVTPEKTAVINYFDLEINNHDGRHTLIEMSAKEPMFIEDFSYDSLDLKKIEDVSNDEVRMRLIGQGFRQQGKVSLSHPSSKSLDQIEIRWISRSAYEWKMKKADLDGLTVIYRLGNEEKRLSYSPSPPAAPTIAAILNPETGTAEGKANSECQIVIRGNNLDEIRQACFGNKCVGVENRSPNALILFAPPGKAGTVYVLLYKQPLIEAGKLPPVAPANLADIKVGSTAIFTYK